MKIQVTHYNKTYTAEGPDDGDIVSVLEDFKGLLVACGFHPRTVDSHLPHLSSQWWPEDEEEMTFLSGDDPEGSTRDQLNTFEPQQLSENDEPTNY